MSNQNLEKLVQQAKQNPEVADAFGMNIGDSGDHTKDEVLKQEILREIIYANSGEMSVGTELVGTRQMTQKAIKWTYPGSTTAEYPVAPDTLTDRVRFDWSEFGMELKRGQARYFISDDAKLSGMADVQAERAANQASKALARRKDENIVGTLYNGVYQENESTAAQYWNHPDAGDGVEDVMIEELRRMWEQILVNTPLEDTNPGTLQVVLPVQVYTRLSELKLINNIQQSIEDWLSARFDFEFIPHKMGMHEDSQIQEKHGFNPQDVCMMILSGDETAIHGELAPGAARTAGVPLTEGPNREFGLGEDYLITQWFNTGVMSHETGNEGETPRIAVRNAVNYFENQ